MPKLSVHGRFVVALGGLMLGCASGTGVPPTECSHLGEFGVLGCGGVRAVVADVGGAPVAGVHVVASGVDEELTNTPARATDEAGVVELPVSVFPGRLSELPDTMTAQVVLSSIRFRVDTVHVVMSLVPVGDEILSKTVHLTATPR